MIEVLSGECDFSLSGKPRKLKPGDLLYMPPGAPHAVKALTQFSMLLTLFKPDGE
jgi:quercetin dioxygenase-like cupin family protein